MYIFDFENTLTDYEWRKNKLPSKEIIKNKTKEEKQLMWDIFHEKMFMDEPRWNNCALYTICCMNSNVIILTGCDDKLDHRQQIELWLEKWQFPKPHDLIMRPEGNFQSAPDFKLKICNELKKYDSDIFVFDDRRDVIEKLMQNGIPGIIVS